MPSFLNILPYSMLYLLELTKYCLFIIIDKGSLFAFRLHYFHPVSPLPPFLSEPSIQEATLHLVIQSQGCRCALAVAASQVFF